MNFSQSIEKIVEIERVNLYLFRTGVAVFTMDMVIPRGAKKEDSSGWTLAEFQTFHDLARRAYAPYFNIKDGKRSNGDLVLDNIAWLDKDQKPLMGIDGQNWSFELNDDLGAASGYVKGNDAEGGRVPPLFRHWRVLLSPHIPLAGYDRHKKPVSKTAQSAAKARWHHVVDERMATLATVSVTDETPGIDWYNNISDGDMVRLGFADSSGSDPFPYDEGFLKDFDARFAYDRFRSGGTRFLISGYSFVALVSNSFGDNIIAMHMRRHYFQMALLAHMEMASLLGFSGQVSRAVQKYGSEDADRLNFERSMAAIQEEFLQFMHRFRFTGVSNQLQPQELFELWRRNLRTDSLFADVKEEIEVANDFLRSEADRRSTDSAEWLSVIGAIGVIFGVIIGLLGMNFLAQPDLWRPILEAGGDSKAWEQVRLDVMATGGLSAAVGAVSGGVFWLWSWKRKSKVMSPVIFISIALVVLGLAALGVASMCHGG